MSATRIMLLWLMWKLLRWPSVVLVDHDGEPNARLVGGSSTFRIAARHGFGVRTVRLLNNGTTTGASYVKTWEPLFPPSSPSPAVRGDAA